MKNVFVTGATGFVGPYLLRVLLQRGYRVFALHRPNSAPWLRKMFHKVHWLEGDILDLPRLEGQLEGMQAVYHAAALVSFDPRRRAETIRINAEGTANLVEAALLQGVEAFLHFSSIAALGRRDQQLVMDEDLAWENNSLNSPYAIAKFKAECEVWRGMESGLQACILNPGVILGAGNWAQGSPQLFHSVYRGLRYYPQGSSGFIDVRDLAELAVLALEAELFGQRYIAVGHNWAYQRLFSEMAENLGVRPPLHPLPSWLEQLAWRGEALRSRLLGREAMLTRETLSNAQRPFVYRQEKLLKALPQWQYRPLEQTIQETAAAYLADRGASPKGPFSLLP